MSSRSLQQLLLQEDFDWLSSAKGTGDHGDMAAMARKVPLLFALISIKYLAQKKKILALNSDNKETI